MLLPETAVENSAVVREWIEYASYIQWISELLKFVDALDEVANLQYTCPFVELDQADSMAVFRKVSIKHVRLSALFVQNLLCWYYGKTEVLQRLGLTGLPLFPTGNDVFPGDLSLLEEVLSRGPIDRLYDGEKDATHVEP